MLIDKKGTEMSQNGHRIEAMRNVAPPSSGVRSLVFLLGLTLAAVGSCGVFLARNMHPEFADTLPYVSFERALVTTGLSFALLSVFAYHSHQQLVMLNMKMPMIPSPVPFLGQALLFLKNSPWDLLLSWHRQVGPYFSFVLLGRRCVSLAHPGYLKLVLQSKIRSVKKDVNFAYKPFLVILGHGIVTSENHSWMKQRLKMSTALRIDVLDVIPRVTLHAVQRLMTQLDQAAATNTPVELAESLRHLTLQVISSTFLSLSAEESDSTFAKLYLPIMEECHKRVWHPERHYAAFLPAFWKHSYQVSRLNSYVSSLIRKRWTARKESGTRQDDILDRVLDAYEKEYPNQKLLPASWVRQFRDEMKTFMLAGHETSAAMMTWALYELMGNDMLMKELSQEGEAVFGRPTKMDWMELDSAALPPRDRLANLIVSEGCLKEALRKYTVVPLVTRRTIAPVKLDSQHVVPAGTTLIINMFAVHHNAQYWPDPIKFDPHRFTDPDKRPEPYTFLPFIDGPRNCLGQHLALLESKMVLGLLTQRYRISMAHARPIETDLNGPSDPRHRYMVPLIPKEEMLVTVRRK